MDHGFESEIDLAGANNLSDILGGWCISLPCPRHTADTAYAGVIRLEQSNLDAFLLEVALRLSQVERGVVWRSMPGLCQPTFLLDLHCARVIPTSLSGK